VLKHGGTKTIQQVEIDREVIDVSKKYFPSLSQFLDHPKVNIVVMDAIEYIRETKEKFDVILIN